jgi:hypothetical protein
MVQCPTDICQNCNPRFIDYVKHKIGDRSSNTCSKIKEISVVSINPHIVQLYNSVEFK